jgi:hypothetical protein
MWQESTPYWLYTNERGDHGATDTLTILAESIPYFKDILCNSIETKETYEYHLNGCIVTNADTINLYIHPNPVEDQLHVEMHCGVSGLASYSILDLNGRVLAEGQADFKAPLGFFDISLPPATDPRSIYTLYVSLEEAKGYMHFMQR